MVINSTILKILSELEKYLLEKINFKLRGIDYDLIFIVPSESNYLEKYSWIISAKILDNIDQNVFLKEILSRLKSNLLFEEYITIASINKVNSNEPFVKNINFLPFRNFEFTDYPIGGIHINKGIVLNSKILSKLVEYRATTINLKNGDRISAGIISMEKIFVLKHFTEPGLRELFNNNLNSEQKDKAREILAKDEQHLIDNKYIRFTNLDEIESID